MRLLLFALAVLFGLPVTAAAQPAPLPWGEVVDRAELIAKVRVVEGGRFGARVEAVETYKGEAPDEPFLVLAFTDPSMPPEILALEGMRRDEVVWLFLERWEGVRPGIDIPVWIEEDWEPVPGRAWVPASPVVGDVPLRDGKVHVSMVHGGFHHMAPTLSVDAWEDLLQDMVAARVDGQVDAAGLEAARACLDGPVSEPDARGETPDARCIAELHMRGQRDADPRLARFAEAGPLGRGAAAGLAAHADTDAFDAQIRRVILDDDPDAPYAMVLMAADGGQARIARLAVEMLQAARGSQALPGTTLAQLRDETRREQILAVLVEVGDPSVKEELLAELRYLNPHHLFIAIEALEGIAPGSWVEAAFALLERPERERSYAILEAVQAHRPEQARGPLQSFIEREDVPPGLQRAALRALGQVGDAASAAWLRERLEARLAFEGRWPDDRMDMVGAELEALAALEGGDAADIAWIVARQYVGEPRSLVDPAHSEALKDEGERLRSAVARVLPPDTPIRILVSTEREGGLVDRGERVVLVDVEPAAGVSEALRRSVARAAGTEPERVRMCGRDETGRVRCLRDRGDFWEPHPSVLLPMLDILTARAGLTERPSQPPDPEAARWLALALTRGWMQTYEVEHGLWDGWTPLFHGPYPEDEMPRLVPPDIAPFDPSAPAR